MAKGDFSEKVEVRSENDVLGISMNQMVESFVSVVDQANIIAKGDYSSVIKPRSDNDSLGKALYRMTETLRNNSEEIKRQDWLKTGYNALGNTMKDKNSIHELTDAILGFYCDYLEVQLGILFIHREGQMVVESTYAVTSNDKNNLRPIAEGDGLVGQVFKDKKPILLKSSPGAQLPIINYTTGKKTPDSYLIQPIMHNNEIVGVILFGSLNEPDKVKREFLSQSLKDVAITLKTLQSHLQVKELLKRTQEQANELEVQQEELKQANEELQEHTKALKISEENLQSQKEELNVTNEELEERTKALEIQRDAIKRKNKELEIAQLEIENKARDIARGSQYKSEFLANMSHELRTPLNSIIVLSQLLAENKYKHLNEKELQYSTTINSSGNDLLNLINDILDLSKIESGKIELFIERLYFTDLKYYVEASFKPLLEEKNIELKCNIETGKYEFIDTDVQRVQQIVKNLFSNAVKFTEKGSISLDIRIPDKNHKFNRPGLSHNSSVIISVIDTGIGIPPEKQDLIFEAFKQADGTTSRKYGGTGLGLSISRNFTTLLGGEMSLESEDGKGSKFSIVLPLKFKESAETKTESVITKTEDVKSTGTPEEEETAQPAQNKLINDDLADISDSDNIILIVEDDYNFASVLLNLAHQHGFKGLIALDGEKGLYYADYYQPKAIIMDIGLPGMDGYQVMEKLKSNSKTRHIPVHFLSAADRKIDAFEMGAIGYLTKPADKEQIEKVFDSIESLIAKPVKKLLVVEDEALTRKSIVELMKSDNISITEVEKGEDAISEIKKEEFDCMILDLGLTDMTGFEVIEKLNKQNLASKLPIIVYTSKELTQKENEELKKYSQSIILKGAHSFERLLSETTLFLHQVEAKMPDKKREMLETIHGKENVLDGKTILVVDDDMRNVFALSSLLESNNAIVVVGKNGKEGIAQLQKHTNIDLVLMDIMMPEMDGYEAMRLIRKEKKWKDLPIIALTAKAMKEDRQKCIDAGANEYLSKPVEKEKLISLLRVWLYK
jgi:CheY-like chemotaxis protein/signal transduction histidine kinase